MEYVKDGDIYDDKHDTVAHKILYESLSIAKGLWCYWGKLSSIGEATVYDIYLLFIS